MARSKHVQNTQPPDDQDLENIENSQNPSVKKQAIHLENGPKILMGISLEKIFRWQIIT